MNVALAADDDTDAVLTLDRRDFLLCARSAVTRRSESRPRTFRSDAVARDRVSSAAAVTLKLLTETLDVGVGHLLRHGRAGGAGRFPHVAVVVAFPLLHAHTDGALACGPRQVLLPDHEAQPAVHRLPGFAELLRGTQAIGIGEGVVVQGLALRPW